MDTVATVGLVFFWTVLVFRFGRFWGGMARHYIDGEQAESLIPEVLLPGEALSSYQIVERIERRVGKSVDPSTLLYAIDRLEKRGMLGMVKRDVDVPGPLGSTRREVRHLHYVTRSYADG